MTISWHGNYTVKIVTHGTTIIIDPHSAATGLKPPRGKANFCVLSNPIDTTMSYVDGLQGEPTIIAAPGEYALDGFTLYARGWHDKDDTERTVQRWHIEHSTLLYLGALNRPLAAPELQELEQSDIDILLLPVGGGSGLDTAQALEIITTLEPHVVIPIHYHLPKMKEKIETIDHFAKEMGIDPKATQPKLTITAAKLPKEGLETILLSP